MSTTTTEPKRQAQQSIVSIDYLRLATWNFQTYCELSARMRRKFVGWRKSRWLQYKLERSQESVAYGLAEQNGKPHGIFEASGVDAHIFATWLLNTQGEFLDSLYCSRIDLQCTKEPPKAFDYVKAHKRLKNPKSLVLGSDGNTLYIGNRQSESFVRIYDKEEDAVRLEIELKGKQAKRTWNTIRQGKSSAELYDYYLSKSRVPSLMVKHYSGHREPLNEDELATVVPVDLETKYLWLASLDQLVFKLVNDHDVGERTRILVQRWAEYSE